MSLTIGGGSAVKKQHKAKLANIGKSPTKHDGPKAEYDGPNNPSKSFQVDWGAGKVAPTDGAQISPEAKEPASTETDARKKLGPLLEGLKALNPGG